MAEKYPSHAQALAKIITDHLGKAYAAGARYIVGEPIVTPPIRTSKEESTVRFQPVTAPMLKTHFSDRAICVKMCKDEVVEPSHLLKKFFKHFDYGVIKPKIITTGVAGKILTPEEPEWGLPHVEIPLVQNMRLNPEWQKSMKSRWEQLYHLAANFDPHTGYIKPTVLPSNGGSIQSSGTCSDFLREVSASPERQTPFQVDLTDWFHPADVKPSEAFTLDAPYLREVDRIMRASFDQKQDTAAKRIKSNKSVGGALQ